MQGGPIFHTVHKAALILRVDAATIYRAIRAGSFPAVRIRCRYVIPAAALRDVAAKAVSSGTRVDLGNVHGGRWSSRYPMRTPRSQVITATVAASSPPPSLAMITRVAVAGVRVGGFADARGSPSSD